jgi:oligopeptide/dipeptide ABC transporter ATP-binding protein
MPNPLAPPAGCRFYGRCAHALPICVASEPELEVADGQHVTRCIRWKDIAL